MPGPRTGDSQGSYTIEVDGVEVEVHRFSNGKCYNPKIQDYNKARDIAQKCWRDGL